MCDTIKETTNTGVAPTYKEYQNFLMSAAEKLEDSIIDNSSSQKVNVGETDFLQPYTPADDKYGEASDLSLYMGAQGMDVNMIHDVLKYSKAL